MKWGYPLFVLLLSGFGVVYLAWPTNDVAADYGITAVTSALFLCTLSFTRAWFAWSSDNWQRHVCQGFAIGFWFWVVAGVFEMVDLFFQRPAYASMADFLWVTGYLPMFVGLYSRFKITSSLGKRGARMILFTMIGCYSVIFYLYLLPHLVDPHRALPAKALDLVYFSFNFTLFTMVFTISRDLSALHSRFTTAFHMMTTAMLIMIVSDILLSYYTSRESFIFQLLDLPYFLIYFLFFQTGQEMVKMNRDALAPLPE